MSASRSVSHSGLTDERAWVLVSLLPVDTCLPQWLRPNLVEPETLSARRGARRGGRCSQRADGGRQRWLPDRLGRAPDGLRRSRRLLRVSGHRRHLRRAGRELVGRDHRPSGRIDLELGATLL